jgi:hypothetical protein
VGVLPKGLPALLAVDYWRLILNLDWLLLRKNASLRVKVPIGFVLWLSP